ncbi:MAG: hypothetical protein H7144_00540 [Burkholderiales bacterium]|nr:hypothetical protein [Phycisphaerae bacterium]
MQIHPKLLKQLKKDFNARKVAKAERADKARRADYSAVLASSMQKAFRKHKSLFHIHFWDRLKPLASRQELLNELGFQDYQFVPATKTVDQGSDEDAGVTGLDGGETF